MPFPAKGVGQGGGGEMVSIQASDGADALSNGGPMLLDKGVRSRRDGPLGWN